MLIAIDTETTLIRGNEIPYLVCVSMATDDQSKLYTREVNLKALFVDKDNTFAFHNAPFDLAVIIKANPEMALPVIEALTENRIVDTMLIELLKDIAKGVKDKYSLEAVAKSYGLQKKADDPWRTRYGELINTPLNLWPQAAKDYAIHDAEVTYEIAVRQKPWPKDIYNQVRAAFGLHLTGSHTINIDPVAFELLLAREQERFDAVEMELKSAGLVKANGSRSIKAARERMASVVANPALTKTKQIALSEEACLDSGDPLLESYAQYSGAQRYLSRLRRLRGATSTYGSFYPLLATGRTSCRTSDKGGGYQLQNVSRKPGERECFVPPPGRVILACDYDKFELCTWAQVCLWSVGYSAMAETLNLGVDPHTKLGARLAGISYHVGMPKMPQRQTAKIANFGLPGGMGPKTFVTHAKSQGVIISLDESIKIRESWREEFPEANDYFAWINNRHEWRNAYSKKLKKTYQVTTLKHYVSERMRGRVAFTEACNSYFQGLAADAAKAAVFYLVTWAEFFSDLKIEFWNFVHDELIATVPEEHAQEAAKLVPRYMAAVAQRWIPDIKITADATLMRRWSKQAESKLLSDGSLTIWEG